MNPECSSILNPLYANKQPDAVRRANEKARVFLKRKPFLDLARVVEKDICNLSADGLHLKQWVDVIRAQILLQEICSISGTFHIPEFMKPHPMSQKFLRPGEK